MLEVYSRRSRISWWASLTAKSGVAWPGRLIMLGLLAGCGGGATNPTPPPPPPPPPPSGGADVAASLTAPGGRPTGQVAQYRATVRNIGGLAAEDVEISLELREGLTVTAVSDDGDYDRGTVTWPSILALAAGESVVRTVDLEVPAVGPLEATIRATTTSADRNDSNNDGTASNATVGMAVTFDPIRTVSGESPGDQFGWLMEALGDVDADGVDDFVVGAPSSGTGGASAGRVYVYSGVSGTEIHRFTGQAGETLGTSLDLAGDVDNDGVPDVVAGAPGGGTAGRAYVYSGATGSVIHVLNGETAGDRFGTSVGRLGDVDSDNFDDFLVTAPNVDGSLTRNGRVYVYSGRTGTVLVTADGDVANGQFGAAVGGLGDLTGDGIPDFGVGALGDRGRIYAFSGADGTRLLSIAPDATASALGQFWLNSPGDLNGDGVPEIYAADIQNSGAAGFAGRAYAFSGSDGSTVRVFDGEAGGDGFGIGRGIPDVTGDGVGDLFLAAWLADEGAQNAGKAYVFSGSDGTLVRTFASQNAGENFGFDAVGIGDLNGDGVRDFLISGGLSATSPGLVYVVAGTP